MTSVYHSRSVTDKHKRTVLGERMQEHGPLADQPETHVDTSADGSEVPNVTDVETPESTGQQSEDQSFTARLMDAIQNSDPGLAFLRGQATAAAGAPRRKSFIGGYLDQDEEDEPAWKRVRVEPAKDPEPEESEEEEEEEESEPVRIREDTEEKVNFNDESSSVLVLSQQFEEEVEPDTDGFELDSKTPTEAENIILDIGALEESVPEIDNNYKIVTRLGEGTFSSVYKAIDLHFDKYDNSHWYNEEDDLADVPPKIARRAQRVRAAYTTDTNHSRKGKVYVALKRIYVTSSPTRIYNEIDILHSLRTCPNTAHLVAALRREDQVIVVMPYNRHQDFRTYFRRGSMPLLRSYFASLFKALGYMHHEYIIHRDVKPANFLYDLITGTGVLCDFGLAQKVGDDHWFEWRAECCHSLPGPSLGAKGRMRLEEERSTLAEGVAPGIMAGLHGARLKRPLDLYEQAIAIYNDHLMMTNTDLATDKKRIAKFQKIFDLRTMKMWNLTEPTEKELHSRYMVNKQWYESWHPMHERYLDAAKTTVSRAVTPLSANTNAYQFDDTNETHGFLPNDTRPHVRANRAGTRGFRAPEVLFKCPDQTMAIDIWSVGVILLSFLSRRFPFFTSSDDTEALLEIAALLGKKKMASCAALHNRTFFTNIPNVSKLNHADFHQLIKQLNPAIVVENSPNPNGPIPSTAESDAEWYQGSELYLAVDLLKRCLEPDCTKRWTAEECLAHPFFDSGEYEIAPGVTAPRSDQYRFELEKVAHLSNSNHDTKANNTK